MGRPRDFLIIGGAVCNVAQAIVDPAELFKKLSLNAVP